jgi:peptidoglycan/xylan/chitin deacetylase (PgdA/CDA1 family)
MNHTSLFSKALPFIATVGIVAVAFGTYTLFSKRASSFISFINTREIARYYTYKPKAPVVSGVDTATRRPAQAVPVLLYHGVTAKADTENTTQKNFVAHMEALKRNGYETISVDQLYQFLQGKFTLPPKPIIITFDDGRKDSFYPTDDVFKKLGFTATLFVATGPERAGNNFYLTREELQTVRDTGRWEIEAHGRQSHDHIITSPDTSDLRGRFLSSKRYLLSEDRLETDLEFSTRIETDYQNNIADLKEWLGITPLYWAIPLNDYGRADFSNYPAAGKVNDAIVKKYFKLAFLQANDSDDTTHIVEPPYNFRGENPYTIRRIEVKNMPADTLIGILERFAPRAPRYDFATDATALVTKGGQEGTLLVDPTSVELIADAPNTIATFLVGLQHWTGYTTTTTLIPRDTQSSGVIVAYQDPQNYLICGVSGDRVYLQRFQNGVIRELARSVQSPTIARQGRLTFAVHIDAASKLACSVNNTRFFSDIRVPFSRGRTGVKIWDPEHPAEAVIEQFTVSS